MSRTPFRILIAVDGSPTATAALDTARRFPWPDNALPVAVVARGGGLVPPLAAQKTWAWSQELAISIADHACKRLASRWEEPEAHIEDGNPETAIVAAARRKGARAIVVGWRGHGTFRRLLAGSVSRAVLRSAPIPVMVVHRAPRQVRHIVLALDGSTTAARAVRFLKACTPPTGGRVTIVAVVTHVMPPRTGMLTTEIASRIRADIAAHNAQERAGAKQRLQRAAASLKQAGWRVRTVIRTGAPLAEVLDAVGDVHADVLMVGAGGSRTLRLGRIGALTEAAVNRCPVPVLVVR